MEKFEVLYSFESPRWEIFEVKRVDLGQNAPKSEVFHWFKRDRNLRKLERLEFLSMESGSQGNHPIIQRRHFKDHALSFTEDRAVLDFGDEVEEMRPCRGIGEDSRELVSKFLRN